MADTSDRRELLKGQAAVQASDCRKRLGLCAGAGTCLQRWAQVEDLLQQMPELQEVVRRLCNIKGAEQEIDS